MILPDWHIREYVNKKRKFGGRKCSHPDSIRIEPEPDEDSIQPASVDLTLSREVFRFDRKVQLNVTQDQTHAGHTETHEDDFVLDPQEFALGSTVEEISLPSHISAIVKGRSTVGRMGLSIHTTAGFVDPGFQGNITLEMTNHNNVPLVIPTNIKIAQIIFVEMSDEASIPYDEVDSSKYCGQSGPTPPKGLDD